MISFLNLIRFVRRLHFLLSKIVLELNFSARDTTFWSVIQVSLNHCVARVRFDTNPEREDISRSLKLLRDLLHAVKIMLTKSLHLLSGILNTRFLALSSAPRCAQAQ